MDIPAHPDINTRTERSAETETVKCTMAHFAKAAITAEALLSLILNCERLPGTEALKFTNN
jgi:hypothetical protein